MSSPGYYKQGKKLEEGSIYSFKYVKLVTLSDDNEYMILEDQFGIRHTIPYDYYKYYGLVIGSMIECKVDKINCTGRVFLEPEHPLYKVGEVHDFSIVDKSDGEAISIIDCFNNIIKVTVDSERAMETKLDTVKAKIIKLTRGQPELEVLA